MAKLAGYTGLDNSNHLSFIVYQSIVNLNSLRLKTFHMQLLEGTDTRLRNIKCSMCLMLNVFNVKCSMLKANLKEIRQEYYIKSV